MLIYDECLYMMALFSSRPCGAQVGPVWPGMGSSLVLIMINYCINYGASIEVSLFSGLSLVWCFW